MKPFSNVLGALSQKDSLTVEETADRDGAQGNGWPRRYAGPLLGMLVIVVTGMAYSFFWPVLIYHAANWMIPDDLWNTYRASEYIVWQGAGQIYNNPAAFQTFPGIAVILTPIAKLAGVLNLSASTSIQILHPTTWFILGPVELVLGSLLLFPLDKLAQLLSISSRRRAALVIAESILIWPALALWGHPEDPLALALGIYGLIAVLDGAWFRTGIWFGLAIAVQPLVILIAPLLIALVPLKRWLMIGLEMLIPSVALLLPPLIQEWGPSTRILLQQPNYLQYNHATPWASLAPILKQSHVETVRTLKYVKLANGEHRSIEVVSTAHFQAVLAAGPGRIIVILVACLLGVLVKMRQVSTAKLLWLAALALSLRCEFEPVMVPYYLLPGLALALVVASTKRSSDFFVVCVAAGTCTVLSYLHLNAWIYYFAMSCPLFVALAWAWPRRNALAPLVTPDVQDSLALP